ncbi:MAG: glutamate 5-kinase [Actinobacteria bacterium]|nr:glutamate 5-kinase [Actinomycetota bacterium]
MERKKYIKKIKRAVIKIGTSSLTSENGNPDILKMKKFTEEVADVADMGIEVVIVTSGAIAAGLKYLGIMTRPKNISTLQAAAAVGQVELMGNYGILFSDRGMKVGQILLTREDITRRMQYLNIRNTIENLLKLKVIPIINENDSVAVEEIKFGDNDRLAALVSSLTGSDLLIMLTDTEGLYDKNPEIKDDSGKAKLISFVEKITPEVEKLAGGTGSRYSLGGMASKIKAAKICSFLQIPSVIAGSSTENVISRIINFEPVGTFFAPQIGKRVNSVKRWIAFGMQTKGSIIIDDGAAEAVKRGGKSILPVGVVDVEGDFAKGDMLKVYSTSGLLIAKGISNFTASDIDRIKGKNENTVLQQFGRDMCFELIHRDSLVVFNENDCDG